MLLRIKTLQTLIICTMMMGIAYSNAYGQTTPPNWWFGFSGAANMNFYDGTTQRLNNSLIIPKAFHDGFGVRPYGSFLMEYRPGRIWGLMLNLGYDGRGGKFDTVIAACNCPATLKTNTSYLVIEPSLRLGFNSSNFYLFAGPRVGFNFKKDFEYTQLKQPDTDSELSEMRKTVLSGQVGIGYDILVSSPNSLTKVSISPFVSYHPYFGQDPRKIESWSVTTVRAGIALKFGKGSKIPAVAEETPAAAMPTRDVNFTVRGPINVPLKRMVSETLPLRNYVFFDEGSSEIPARYIALSSSQANLFKENQLQSEQSVNMPGRSSRQLQVYYNILNILGDRLRSNPGTAISLSGASMAGPEEGELFADHVKQYLVSAFGIDAARISTQGRTKPLIPAEQPGDTKELVLRRAGDRRVDIESASPALLLEVGGGIMKPVQITAMQTDPLDSHLIMNVAGAEDLLKTWSVDVSDANGTVQHFGPFVKDQESLPGKSILGDRIAGNYKIVMNGETKNGLPVRKETTVNLIRQDEALEKGYRYSILFDFNKSATVASYEKFLTDIVSPLISDGSTVIIHGHTDVIGEDEYNYKLSQSRAQDAQKIIARALSATGRGNIKFEIFGFGEDQAKAPFENNLPEERFYNRTVIIDIIPNK